MVFGKYLIYILFWQDTMGAFCLPSQLQFSHRELWQVVLAAKGCQMLYGSHFYSSIIYCAILEWVLMLCIILYYNVQYCTVIFFSSLYSKLYSSQQCTVAYSTFSNTKHYNIEIHLSSIAQSTGKYFIVLVQLYWFILPRLRFHENPAIDIKIKKKNFFF